MISKDEIFDKLVNSWVKYFGSYRDFDGGVFYALSDLLTNGEDPCFPDNFKSKRAVIEYFEKNKTKKETEK